MTVYHMLNHEHYLNISYHERAKTYFATCYILRKGGILYTVTSHRAMPLTGELVDDTVKRGNFSRRKYLLGQPPDATVVAPVFHLFDQYCRSRGLSALDLYRRAYPAHGCTEEDRHAALWLAEWQGTELVLEWSSNMVRLLTEALSGAHLYPLIPAVEATERRAGILQPSL